MATANTIDERYEDLPAGTSVPMDALFNGDTHRERLAALAGALTDEQVEHALHVLTMDAAFERGILPPGVADYMASVCRRYPEVRYGVTRIGYDVDGDAQIEVIFYIDSGVKRDGMTLLKILDKSLPRRYRYLDIRNDVVDIRRRAFKRSWWGRKLDEALAHQGTEYALYERAGDLIAPAPAPAPTQTVEAETSQRWLTPPAQAGDLVWVNEQGDLIAGSGISDDVGLGVMPVGIWVDGQIMRAGHIIVPSDFRIDATESEDEDDDC